MAKLLSYLVYSPCCCQRPPALLAVLTAGFLLFSPVLAESSAARLSKPEQEKLALAIFKKLVATPRDEHETFRRLYYQVIQRCPDTARAEVAHWRLSNLLLLAYHPPRNKEAIALLEGFLKRYPGSRGVPHVRQRLVRLYEESKQWCKAADIYGEMVPKMPTPPSEQAVAYYLSYADALAGCGRKNQARIWYRRVLAASKGSSSFLGRLAQEGLTKLEGK